jgi:methyltransferase (TIGR00027 family)
VPTGNNAITAAWVLRSRYTEDCLEAARERGVRQYVILGAGLDSFALRAATTASDLTVFEVDAPRTQQWKRKRLTELGLEFPKNLRLAPCNFETMSVEVALAGTEFRPREPAFLSWLGVTQYLTRDAIAATLQWAARLAPGSELVLTFVPPSAEMIEVGRRISAATGVNFATFFTADQMATMLRTAGFAEAEHFSPERAQRTYFEGRSDGLSAPEVEQLMRARTT